MFNNTAKILVVDDERINIQILFEGLSDEYDILATSCGAEAIRVATEQLPDLILLDIMLGNVSGYDVCKALKNNSLTQNIPVIFVTGKDSIEDEMIGLEHGAVDYFRKPFNVALVRVRIRKQVELAQKTAILEHMSMIDGLTGIANRRQFDNKLADSIRYVDRNHRGLSLLLIDIDYFKQFNDTYGHVKGDEVLKQVAKLLAEGAARPFDFVARYGGEEFAVLITDANNEEGLFVAEKLRALVENKNIAHQGSHFKCVTISVGVTYVEPNRRNKIDAEEFIEDADQCLYMAKSQGRNQVIASTLIID